MTARVRLVAVCVTCCVSRPLSFTPVVKAPVGGLP